MNRMTSVARPVASRSTVKYFRVLVEEMQALLHAEKRAEIIRLRTGKPVKVRSLPSRVSAKVKNQLVVHRVAGPKGPAD